jgi:hypothetical protein
VKREIHLFVLPLVTLLALAAAPVPSRGDTLADRLSAAGSKAKAGRHLEAFEDLKAAEFELWQKMPAMKSRRVVLVTEEPAFFGSYLPKPDNRYRKGEPVLIYVEPVGYTISEEEGLYRFLLTADFTLVSGKGEILGGQRDFGRWEMTSRQPVTEFMMFFTYDFSGLSPGEYTIETLIKDANSERTLTLNTPIVVE